jgi:hypothetical protein
MNRKLLLLPCLATLGVASVAEAQAPAWLADRRYTEGRGIEVGDFELHPGIGVDFGYDTNFFRRADDEDPIGALRLRVTPSFSIATQGAQRRPDAPPPMVAFRAGIHATYEEFIGVSGSEGGKDQMSTNRNVGGMVDLSLDIAQGRPVFGGLRAGLSRRIEPSNAGFQGNSFNRLIPTGAAEIGFAPGGGLFDWRFGYSFTGTFFEADPVDSLDAWAMALLTAFGADVRRSLRVHQLHQPHRQAEQPPHARAARVQRADHQLLRPPGDGRLGRELLHAGRSTRLRQLHRTGGGQVAHHAVSVERPAGGVVVLVVARGGVLP